MILADMSRKKIPEKVQQVIL